MSYLINLFLSCLSYYQVKFLFCNILFTTTLQFYWSCLKMWFTAQTDDWKHPSGVMQRGWCSPLWCRFYSFSTGQCFLNPESRKMNVNCSFVIVGQTVACSEAGQKMCWYLDQWNLSHYFCRLCSTGCSCTCMSVVPFKRHDSSWNHESGYRGCYHTPVQYLLSHFLGALIIVFHPEHIFGFCIHAQIIIRGLNMYMRFKVPSFFSAAVNKMHALLKETVWQGANYKKKRT